MNWSIPDGRFRICRDHWTSSWGANKILTWSFCYTWNGVAESTFNSSASWWFVWQWGDIPTGKRVQRKCRVVWWLQWGWHFEQDCCWDLKSEKELTIGYQGSNAHPLKLSVWEQRILMNCGHVEAFPWVWIGEPAKKRVVIVKKRQIRGNWHIFHRLFILMIWSLVTACKSYKLRKTKKTHAAHRTLQAKMNLSLTQRSVYKWKKQTDYYWKLVHKYHHTDVTIWWIAVHE